MAALAIADSTGATTPDETAAETSVAATPDVGADTSVATTPDGAALEILPPDEPWAGVTRAEWEARSWQMWLSLPEEVSPGLDTTGERCGYGQNGPVFFLPGIASNEVLDFTCVVAEGTAIFANPVGVACSTIEPPPPAGWNEDELTACANDAIDDAVQVRETHAQINGQEVADLEPYRITSTLFTLTVGENNLAGWEPSVSQAVSVSFSIIIAPPPPGEYEIVISTTYADSSEQVVTYNVTVEAPQVLDPPPTT